MAGPLIINGFLDAQGTPGELTSDAYRPALLTMVGVLAIGFVANLLVRPVAERYHEKGLQKAAAELDREDEAAAAGGGVATTTRTGTATATQTRTVLLTVAWAVVGIPLVYGIFQTVAKTLSLFG